MDLSKLEERSCHSSTGEKAGPSAFSCLGDLLAFYGRTTASKNAIVAPGSSPITYGELWARSSEVIQELRRLGIGSSDRVAVILPRGPQNAVAVVAIAIAAVCVPLNPDFTSSELQRYLADLNVAALVTHASTNSAGRDVAHGCGIPVIELLPQAGGGPGAFNLVGSRARRAIVDDLAPNTNDAFILLTSGSGSQPKMVPLTHASVCLSAYNVGAALALAPRDRLLNVLPLFHVHGLVSGLLTALAAGSSVICTSAFDANSFFKCMREFKPSWYTAVPTIHQSVLSAAEQCKYHAEGSSLRIIRSASARLAPDVLNALESLFGVPVIDTYGMTEAASQIAANPLERRKPGSVGQAAGPEIAIMDCEGQQLSVGQHGEIVLRGPTITGGYVNNVAATEDAFRNGWFRTGDLGYVDSDGYLFIIGRIKDVIRRGGQQISPVEVEEAVSAHPDVLEAGAFAIPHSRLGENVAVAVLRRPGSNVTPRQLRDFARKRLAAYKVPSLIRIVPKIPKGASGKIKRSALAEMLWTEQGGRENKKILPPSSKLEAQLANIWADLLQLEEIGVDQNVFALGADSLAVTQMLSRLRDQFGVDFSFEDIFDAPTIAATAARLEISKRKLAAASPTWGDTPTNDGSVPLSFQQQRIYFLSTLDPTRHNYNVVSVVRLLGPLNVEALQSSIATICSRHEILRSTFFERWGEPLQKVGSVLPRLECFDFGPCPRSRRAATIRRQARKVARKPFDIEREPPLQLQLLRFDDVDHALIKKIHHIATDGWSQRLFWEELETHYAAARNGIPAALAPSDFQYRNFATWQQRWQRTSGAKDQLDYWRAQLEGITELPLRTDRPRPKIWSGRGARHAFRITRALSAELRSLSQAQSVTIYMTLLAAFQCLLYRYTEHSDVAVGSLVANRNQVEIEPLIGMFANTIILRTDLSGDPPFSELLRRVRQVTLDAYRNQDLAIEEVLKALQVSRTPDRNPLFQVMFILQSASIEAPSLTELSIKRVDVDPGISHFDLTLELFEVNDRISGWFEYSTDLFEASTISRMETHLQTLLKSIAANSEERISDLSLLPEAERERLLTEGSGVQTDFGGLGNFSERFGLQLARAPEAMAVSTAQDRFSYRELDRRSSAIAHRLTLEGIRPDAVVATLAERDADLLAVITAVQRVGGAFLCLEPALPPDRLAKIVESSSPALLLVKQSYVAVLEDVRSRMPAREHAKALMIEDLIEISSPNPRLVAQPAPSSLAYLVYTSGSTGVPKGVMIEQRGLLNHLASLTSELNLSAADVIAQTAPQSFVISVWQFLAGLMVGARVHICSDEIVRDPVLLAQEIANEGVTVLQIVPSLLLEILERTTGESVFRALGRLRLLISTGEPLAANVCRTWFQHFPNIPLVNAYGSSECSDDVALHRLTSAPHQLANAPIGSPIPNTRLYVLDSRSQPVPIGVAGELCVGGVGVGRGYLNDPVQSYRKFIRDHYSNDPQARLYRTGDLALWRADGTLECLGRVDHQVKIRGFRIELKEIEHLLLDCPEVKTATVLPHEEVGSEIRLIAYVVGAAGWQPNANYLRDFLKARLPAYMIPVGFRFLEHMPLTAHGKIDRSALRLITRGERIARDEPVAPRHFTEKILSDIWLDLLKIESIGVRDNFFDLGGHSLLAGQVLARVAKIFGVSLPIKTIFEEPTVEDLSKRIDEASKTHLDKPSLESARFEEDGPRSVSITQAQMMRMERELPGLPQFNLPFSFRLQGPLNVPVLKRCLLEVVRRHASLRAGFTWVDERPVAEIAAPEDINAAQVVGDITIRKVTSRVQSRQAAARDRKTPCRAGSLDSI